ncbi:hypothetical protein [Rummeliibacillus pycnus]|uniref:hypothetical protein n=1 Tax=Rummeliibacillus pycnus TaxID=101070 RepID=UPI0014737353|nr:hypothetical protein [Rummeliibacillus pycnus]
MSINEAFEAIRKEINKLEPEARCILLNRISIEYFGIDRRSNEEKLREEKYLKNNM